MLRNFTARCSKYLHCLKRGNATKNFTSKILKIFGNMHEDMNYTFRILTIAVNQKLARKNRTGTSTSQSASHSNICSVNHLLLCSASLNPVFETWTVNNAKLYNIPPTVFLLQKIDMQSMIFQEAVFHFSTPFTYKLSNFNNAKRNNCPANVF